MKPLLILLCSALSITTCGQKGESHKAVLASNNQQAATEPPECDCCVFDEANQTLDFRTKLAADTAAGQRIGIRGIVYQSDGTTPAANVVMYFYQANNSDRHAKHGTEDRTGFAWGHGYTGVFCKNKP